jgi:Cdc6-like AAA superfamily ATPase
MTIRKPTSIGDIRRAIDELTARAELARKEGRDEEAAEIDARVQAYRDELGNRP